MVDFLVKKYSDFAKTAYLALLGTMAVIMILTLLQMAIGEPRVPMFPWKCTTDVTPCETAVVLPWESVAVIFAPSFFVFYAIQRKLKVDLANI